MLVRAVGYTIAPSIWSEHTLLYMREEMLKGLEETMKTVKWPVRAYTRVNGIIFAVATVLNILPIVFSLCMPGTSLTLFSKFGKVLMIHRLLFRKVAFTSKGVEGLIVEVKQRKVGEKTKGA
jgi:hypothetical protein